MPSHFQLNALHLVVLYYAKPLLLTEILMPLTNKHFLIHALSLSVECPSPGCSLLC